MNRFYFNTGVACREPHVSSGEVLHLGTTCFPFDADAPIGSELVYMCDDPNLPMSKEPNVVVREVFNTKMLSKYAYLRLPVVGVACECSFCKKGGTDG